MKKRKILLLLFLLCYLSDLAFTQSLSILDNNQDRLISSKLDNGYSIENDSIKIRKFRLGLSGEIEATIHNKLDTNLFANVIDVIKLGLTADYLLSEKWNLHADFLVKRTNEDLVVQVDSVDGDMRDFDFGFGLVEVNHFYRLNEFYFFESALVLSRKINKRHSLGLGVGMSYLFGIKGQLVKNQRKIINNRANGELKIVDMDGVINEGTWEKGEEIITSLLSFIQLRYDFRSAQNSTLFLKLNGRYDSDNYLQRPWLTEQDKFLQVAASLGLNYQF